jgi:hypothetical protein
VRFGSQVKNYVRRWNRSAGRTLAGISRENGRDKPFVTNITVDEEITPVTGRAISARDIREAFRIGRVGERVQVYDDDAVVLLENPAH